LSLITETDEQKLFRKQVSQFVDREIRPHVDEWELQGRTPSSLWKRCGDLGYLGLGYPESLGGQGGDSHYSRIFFEELAGCGSLGVCLGILVQTHMATPAIAEKGSPKLIEKILKPALRGEKIGAIAVTEPDCGSDVAGLLTKAIKQADGSYLISGTKMFVTNGIQADFYTILARSSDEPGYNSYSLFALPSDLPGIKCGNPLKKTCFLSSETAEIVFEKVQVASEYLIGEEGKGFKYQMEQFQFERLGSLFMMVGTVKRVYELAKKYASQRNVFGKRLIQHQVTRHKLAQMLSEISLLESISFQCTEKARRGEEFTKEVSMAKLMGAQIQQRICEEGVQIHGGYGLMQEFEVARYFRDSKLASIGGGSNEVMKEIISKLEGYYGYC